MRENETYYQIQRSEWSQYKGMHPFTMTSAELEHLTSLNDRISLQDVQEVYVPMLDYFDVYFKKHIELHTEESTIPESTEEDGTLYYWGLRKCGCREEYNGSFNANDATTTLPK